MKEFSALPKAESGRLIDFAKCEVRPGFLPDTYILIVTGMKPFANMQVDRKRQGRCVPAAEGGLCTTEVGRHENLVSWS